MQKGGGIKHNILIYGNRRMHMFDIGNIKEYEKYITQNYSERIAYRYKQDNVLYEVTYKKFVEKTEGIARFLRDIGLQREPIAIIGKTSCNWFNTYMGILASNNIVVSMDPKIMQNQKENIINEIGAKVVFFDQLEEWQLHGIKKHCHTVEGLYHMESLISEVNEVEISDDEMVDANEIAQYLYTSGTTGESKCVMITYHNILSVMDLQTVRPFDGGQNFLSTLSIHHCYELSCHLSALYNGYTICISDGIENLLDNMRYFQPDLLCVVPAVLDQIIKKFQSWMKDNSIPIRPDGMTVLERELFEKEFGSNLKKVLCGGAQMRPELAKATDYFGIQPIHGYGMTEMCGHTTFNMETVEKPASVGIPVRRDIELKLAADGEILVKGPNLMMGYYKNDNAELFTDDGFFKTGDLGWMDADGYLYITGRKKNVIILDNAENIYPEELEFYVNAIDGVKQAVIFEWKHQIAVMVYPDIGADREKIKRSIGELNKELAAYKRITSLFYREKPFPLTSSGKIKRNDFLDEMAVGQKVYFVPLVTENEKRVGSLVRKLLQITKNVGAQDNFFALGGNSMTALALATELGIMAQTIYENPQIGNLAKVIDSVQLEKQIDESSVNLLIEEQKDMFCQEHMDGVLLTGATGYLGVHILHRLIQEKKQKIYCLVRNPEKLEKVYQYYFGEELPAEVYVIFGDVGKDRLGLIDNVYWQVARNVNTMIHAAANVRHIGDREVFMRINYKGTEEAVQFCKEANATLQFISTYATSGIAVVPIRGKEEIFDEHLLYIGQDYTKNVYVHTKYLSEKKILEERKNGLCANIFRVGSLTSRRSDGRFQINADENGLRNRLLGLLKSGIYTDGLSEYPVNFTPVDECAEALLCLMNSGKANNIYHVLNPTSITMNDIADVAKMVLKRVPKESFEKMMSERMQDKQISEYFFYYKLAEKSKVIPIESNITQKRLRELGFEWEVNSKDYIRRFLLD